MESTVSNEFKKLFGFDPAEGGYSTAEAKRAIATHKNHERNADHVDGYDRDDLGLSADY